MKAIEEKILKNGIVIGNDILKVDSFLNHKIDVNLLKSFAKEVKKFFNKVKVDKVLTIEASGIAVAFAVCEAFDNIEFVFAKKSKSRIVDNEIYTAKIKSFTKNTMTDILVEKQYLTDGENILIIDDFLATGSAGLGLINICRQAGANPVGYATVIEKSFQGGRELIEKEGVRVFAGASIKDFKNNKPVF